METKITAFTVTLPGACSHKLAAYFKQASFQYMSSVSLSVLMVDVTDDEFLPVSLISDAQAVFFLIKYGIRQQNCQHDDYQNKHLTALLSETLVRLNVHGHLQRTGKLLRIILGASGKLW